MSSVITGPYMTSVITYCFLSTAPQQRQASHKNGTRSQRKQKIRKKQNTFPLQLFSGKLLNYSSNSQVKLGEEEH